MDRLTRLAIAISISFGFGLAFFMALQSFFPVRVQAATYWRGPLQIPKLAPPRSWKVSRLAVAHPEVEVPTVLFVGDIMLNRDVARRIKKSGDPSYPFRKLPSGWFDTFDFAVANLEGPVTDKRRSPEKSIDFLFEPSVLPVLKQTGIDAFSQANNHAFDQGRVGYDDSVARLRRAGFLVFGEQVADGEVALATTTVRGMRIALLGFNTTDNALDKPAASAVLKKAKAEADRVLVFMHWGEEYKHKPKSAVVSEAHWLIDQGADAVIGGHPHWEQGIFAYKGKPIAFSLGNFVFDQDFSADTRQGLAVTLTLRESETVLRLHPIQIDASQPRVVEGKERADRLRKLAGYSDPALKEQIETGKVGF